jgi:hypothetical protein
MERCFWARFVCSPGETSNITIKDESVKHDREHKNMLRREEDGPKISRINLKSQANLITVSLPRRRRPIQDNRGGRASAR